MNEAEKQKTIGELKAFYKELKSYKRLLDPERKLSEPQKRYRESLREKLVRKIGKLKETIIQLTGKQFYTQFGSPREFWAEGLSSSGYLPAILTSLGFCIDVTNEAIGKLESTPLDELEPQEVGIKEPPKAFIAHKGETKSLDKLKDFLDALGVQYLIAEVEPSDGRLVELQVTWTYKDADFAIILATKGGVVDKKKGVTYMAMNVADELGRAREVFKNRIILLLETGVEPHTNIGGIVHERFTPQSMDKAFIKITKELRNWGFIRAGKVGE
jgi:predicted nucleotide-binding protein